MRSVSLRLEDIEKAILCLGFVGENEHTRVMFDAKKMYDQYPHAAVSLSVTPPDGESYPAVIERDGDLVIWDVTDSNLTAEGQGEYQLGFSDDPHVARTYVGKFKVKRSIIPTGAVPSALDDFLTRAGAALTAIPETIDAALEEAKESGEFDGEDGVGIQSIAKTGSVGLVDTYTITLTDGRTYGFNVKNGQDGEDGDDGVGISSIRKTGTSGLVDTYTITYTNGQTATFNVTNGAKGDPGDDYVLTEEDKEEIAGMVDLSELEEDVSELKSQIDSVEGSIAPVESSATATSAHAVGELFILNDQLLVALSAIAVGDTITTTGLSPNAAVTTLSSKLIKDVQINGTSILLQGVANIPIAGNGTLGVVKKDQSYGITIGADGVPIICYADSAVIKPGSNLYRPIVPGTQHASVFYGLAKAAGDSTQSSSNNSVGIYTETALSAIQQMLNVPGNWKLLAETTIAETVANVTLTLAYPAHHVLVWIEAEASTGTTSLAVSGIDDNVNDYTFIFQTLGSQISTTKKITIMEFQLLDTGLGGKILYNYNTDNGSSQMRRCLLSKSTTVSGNVFRKIRVGAYNSTANLEPNSIIKIWGR